MTITAQPGPGPTERESTGFFAKSVTRRTSAFVSGGALLLGLVMGGGAAGANGASEVEELTAALGAAELSSEQLSADLSELEHEHESVRDSDLAKTKAIAELKADAGDVATELEARATKITELEAALVAANAAAQAAAAPEPAAPEPAAQAPVVESAYYKNCTAVRDAGAAPIRTGDPGYGSHLDRDGDGVACE